jgi:sigma-E factor negative regulatory protein RseA
MFHTAETAEMSEDPRQSLSALLDGECSQRETRHIVNVLLGDADLTGCWERYHLIGRAIRAEPLNIAARDTAQRVQRALGADVVRMPERAGARRPSRSPSHTRLFAPLATALAAGVALLAVVIGPTGPLDIASPLFLDKAPATAMLPFPDVGTLEGAARDSIRARAVNDLRWQQADPVVRAKLDSLVVGHQERLSEAGIPGFVSYASVVGYEGRP